MNDKKKLPYIFLIFLLLIVVFVLGVNYGKSVEKINKKIDFYVSLTPPPTNSPTPTVAAKINSFSSKECKLNIKYPDNLLVKDSTKEAVIYKEETPYIRIDCKEK